MTARGRGQREQEQLASALLAPRNTAVLADAVPVARYRDRRQYVPCCVHRDRYVEHHFPCDTDNIMLHDRGVLGIGLHGVLGSVCPIEDLPSREELVQRDNNMTADTPFYLEGLYDRHIRASPQEKHINIVMFKEVTAGALEFVWQVQASPYVWNAIMHDLLAYQASQKLAVRFAPVHPDSRENLRSL